MNSTRKSLPCFHSPRASLNKIIKPRSDHSHCIVTWDTTVDFDGLVLDVNSVEGAYADGVEDEEKCDDASDVHAEDADASWQGAAAGHVVGLRLVGGCYHYCASWEEASGGSAMPRPCHEGRDPAREHCPTTVGSGSSEAYL